MGGKRVKGKSDPNQPVSRGMLDEAVTAILEGVGNLMNDFRKKVGDRFDKVEIGLQGVKKDITSEIDGLKAELSDTPTRKELQELKRKVERYHPTN